MTTQTTTIQSLIDLNGKKFDVCLMNPPYDKNLHLKFLEKVIGGAEKTVSVQPCGWMTDTFARDKKSAFNKYENSILKHLSNIEIIDWLKATINFNIGTHQDLGIYTCDKDGGYDYDALSSSGKSKKIINILKNCESFESHIEFDKVDGYRVRTQAVKNAAPNISSGSVKDENAERKKCDVRCKYGLMYKNHSVISKDGWDIQHPELWWSEIGIKNKYTKKKGEPIPTSIKFDTLKEAQNFENYCKTDFFVYCMWLTKVGVHTDFKHLPWLGNVKWHGKTGKIDGYKYEITDEMLYEYYNLSDNDIKLIKDTLNSK